LHREVTEEVIEEETDRRSERTSDESQSDASEFDLSSSRRSLPSDE
jgi:hypothetical protein